MVISSRTPEGEGNVCRVCRNEFRIEPSRPPGDAPCPCCGVLNWFPTPPVEQVPRRKKRAKWKAASE
jgi:hypothetical protein